MRLEELLQRCRADAMPAVGITDRANLFDALAISQEAAQAGIQPLVGCLLPLQAPTRRSANGRPAAAGLAAGPGPEPDRLPESADGAEPGLSRWRDGGARGPAGRAGEAADGLIALTGGPEGPVGRALLHGNREPRRGACWSRAGDAVPGPAVRRADAPRARGRGDDRAGPDRARDRPRSAAGRDQRRALRRGRGVRGARRPAVHRRWRPGRPGAAPPADARSTGSRPRPRCWSCSPICRRRPRTRW